VHHAQLRGAISLSGDATVKRFVFSKLLFKTQLQGLRERWRTAKLRPSSTRAMDQAGSVEKLPNRVAATPSSRFYWNKKAAGRRFYFALPGFSTELPPA
jgi:hypothetical protein